MSSPAAQPTVACPSCGAGHEVRNPGIIMFVCDYCGAAVSWDQDKVAAAGTRAVLPEGFSRLYRGASGSFRKHRFLVLGRVRYSFGRGFWDEWYLELANGRPVWLTEDNHELALQQQLSNSAVPALTDCRLGTSITVGDQVYMVQEVGNAECIGLEGELPKLITAGEQYPYVDAASPDGQAALGIEYDDEPPTVFVGHWLDPTELQLDDEGLEW